MSEDEKKENGNKLQNVFERLKTIDADKAETKAIKILSGLGFH